MPSGIYLGNKGKKIPEYVRRKISLALKGRKGKSHSEESKKKISLFQKGRKKPPRTEEHRKKLGESTRKNMLKLWQNPEYRKRMSEIHKGFKPSKETKLKLSLMRKGHFTSEKTKEKISKSNLGKKRSIKARKNMSNAQTGKIGNKSSHWKGGITPLFILIRNCREDDLWRWQVYKRDNYTCQECGNKGKIAHHIKRFSIIFAEFLKEYSQFSPIEDKETLFRLAIYYKPFWDVSNGRTLCKNCHNKTYKINQINQNI